MNLEQDEGQDQKNCPNRQMNSEAREIETQEAQGKGRSTQTLMQRAGQVNKDQVKLIRVGQTTTERGGWSVPADKGHHEGKTTKSRCEE